MAFVAFVAFASVRTYIYSYRPSARGSRSRARKHAQETVQLFPGSAVFCSTVVLSFLLCLCQWRTYEEKEWQDTFGDSFLASCKFVERAVQEFANTSGFRRGRSCTTWVAISSLLHTAKEESCATV